MAARNPILGVTLLNRGFQTYIRQMQQVQRSQDVAAGSTLNMARAAQASVAELNQLHSAYLVSGDAAAEYAKLTKLVAGTQDLARQNAIDNAKKLQEIRHEEDADRKKSLRDELADTRIRQKEAQRMLAQYQAIIRSRIADMRKEAAQSRDNARQVVADRKNEAAATRVAAAATQQYAIAQAILGAALLSVGVPALALTKNLITVGAEMERFTTAADIAARSAGATREEIEAERDELDSMYVTANQANRLIQQLAFSQVGFARASEVAAMAQDLSVASTLKASQVYEILIQAITTATTVRLRELGLVVDRGRIMNWYAAQLGKEADELTVVEERLAVFNYLQRISEGMQGAFAAQLEKTSGQLVIFDFYLTKIKETLGTALLPAFNNILKVVWQVLKAFNELPRPVQNLIAYATALSGILFTAAGAFLLLKPAISAVVSAIGPLSKFLLGIGSGATFSTSAIGKLVVGLTSLHPALKAAAVAVGLLTAAIVTDFGGLRSLWDRTFGAFLTSVRAAFVDSIPWIRASISVLTDTITWPIRKAFEWLDKQIRKITGDLAKDTWGFEFNAEDFFVGAASIMGSYAAGLLYGLNQFVLPAVIGIVEFMASFLGGSLPTKGPLAHIKTSGIEIIQAWSQGMKSVSLDKLTDLAEEVHDRLQQALYLIQDSIFDIQTQTLELDKALYPFEDALFLARAAADLVIIPLEQQTRELEKQVDALEDVAKAERERAEAYLRILEKQADAMRDVIETDEERLEVIDHEIFIEEQRLKIMGKATSTRLLELKGQKRITEDQLKDNRLSLQTTEDQITAEEERLDALVTAAEAQIAALQAQIDTTNANIEAEEERVTLAQEALRLEEARQAQARLALLEETRFWEEEQRMASHYMDIIGRIPTETQKKTKEAAEDIKKGLEGLFDSIPAFEPEINAEKFGVDIEALKAKLINAFMTPINKELARTRALIDGELTGQTGGPGGEVRKGGLKGAWENLKATFETPLEIHVEALPTADEVFEWGKDLGIKLANGILAGIGIPGFGPKKEEVEKAGDEDAEYYSRGLSSGLTKDGGLAGVMISALDTVSPKVATWIADNIPDITPWREAFLNFTAPLPMLVPPVLEENVHRPLRKWLFDEVDRILFGDSPGGLEDWGQAFLDFPSLFVVDLLADSLELITGILLPWVSPNAEERIIENLITWGNAFINWVEKDSVPYIAEKLDILLTTIVTWVTDVGQPKMVELGEDLSNSMVQGLEDATEANKDRLEDVGKEMLEGIKDGLDDEFDDFRRWLRRKLQAIIDAVEDELGIKSPSTVFSEIGTQMVLGLEEGFGDEADTWTSGGMEDALEGAIKIGQQLVNAMQRGAMEEWPGFEAWLLESVRRLTQEVSYEMGNMTSTVMMAPQNMAPIVHNTTYQNSYTVSANYARTQSEASIRDDIRMMMALG